MTLIDHLSVGVPSIAPAVAFYDGLMATLGCQRLAASEAFAAYGTDTVQFLVMTPLDGRPATTGNGTHICFAAPDRHAVDAFHRFALDHGGRDEGTPGTRPDYPKPDVYTAFVRDPFGNKLEAIHNGFAA